jgi:predicted permease
MSILSYVRPAWRSLRRTPAFAMTASLTLVLGIGAAVAIFALVNGVLLRPLPYGNPGRLVSAWHDLRGVSIRKGNQTVATYFTYKNLARTIEDIGVLQRGAVNLSDPRGGAEPQRIDAAFASASFIPVLGIPPLLGRNFTDAEDMPNGPDVVVISEGLWRSRFGGDQQIVGRMLDVNGRSREVIGVMPQRFRYPNADVQIWLPLQLDPKATFSGGFNYDAVVRLKPGVTPEDAGREFAALLPRMHEQFPTMAPGISTEMLLEQAKLLPYLIPLKQDMTGGVAKTLWIVAAAAGLVLLVACANVTNLILVRADARQRELAVREAIGASRVRVLAHFFAESAVITAIAGAVGLALAAVAIRALVRAGPAEIPRLAEVRIDPLTIGFAVVVSALVALACSVIPALRLGRVRLASALRKEAQRDPAGRNSGCAVRSSYHRLRWPSSPSPGLVCCFARSSSSTPSGRASIPRTSVRSGCRSPRRAILTIRWSGGSTRNFSIASVPFQESRLPPFRRASRSC